MTTLYRTISEPVRAIQVQPDGGLDLPTAEGPGSLAWVVDLIDQQRLTQGPQTWFVKDRSWYFAALYPGMWLVWFEARDRVRAMSDDEFRATFEERA